MTFEDLIKQYNRVEVVGDEGLLKRVISLRPDLSRTWYSYLYWVCLYKFGIPAVKDSILVCGDLAKPKVFRLECPTFQEMRDNNDKLTMGGFKVLEEIEYE